MFDLAFESEELDKQDKEYKKESYLNFFEDAIRGEEQEITLPDVLEEKEVLPSQSFSENSVVMLFFHSSHL